MTDAIFLKSLIFVILLFISAFFSGAETAFTALNKAKLRSLLSKKKRNTDYLDHLLRYPKKLLTCILIGNNVANIAATSFATAFFLDILGTLGITNVATSISIITVIITAILLVFGEITPKTLAMKDPTRWALTISKPIYYIYLLSYPFVWLFYSITTGISKVFGIEIPGSSHLTEEEIKAFIQLGQEDGILEKEEQKMMHGVINVFDKVVREIMTPRTDMVSIDVNRSVADTIALITSKGHSRIPVYEEKIDNIVGFIYAKDLLRVAPKDKPHTLRSVMREPVFIPESKQIQALLEQMRQSKFHLSIIVDEHGGVAGLVTMEDIIEEIVGEIQDEYDTENIPIKKLSNTRYIIDAGVSIEALSEALDYPFPQHDDYDTVAGFILSQLGSFPKQHDKIHYKSFSFTVKHIKNRRIMAFDVTITPPSTDPSD